jgi:5-methylthioadenosine/S-adenosylhomocysteine deaminase
MMSDRKEEGCDVQSADTSGARSRAVRETAAALPADGMTAPPRHTLIKGGRLLDPGAGRADAVDILTAGDTIEEVGPPGLAAPETSAEIDARDRLLMPGLINGHTHGHGALAKGMVGDRLPLEAFLTSSGALSSGRSVEDKYLSTLLSAVEMIRKGCTACYDLHVEYPVPSPDGMQAVGQAYHDAGMRAVVAPMMADKTLYQALPGLMDAMPANVRAEVERIQAAPYEASIEGCRAILGRWPFDRDRVRPALAPTIPLHCSDDFLVACRDLARDFDVGVQTHLAESKAQAVLGQQKYGRSLTAHLDGLGLLGPRFSAAHAIWIDRDDIRRLADVGAGVSHNALSNLRLGSGLAPVRLMLSTGLTVGIGTDSTNTSDTQNMFEAMRLASYISRIQMPEYDQWLTVEEVLTMATVGSAAVLGFDGTIGRIAPGYKADIVFLDLADVNYLPFNNPPMQVVNAESGGAIDSVMIDGRMVFEGGRMLTVDEAKLRSDVERTVSRLNEVNAANLAFARAIEDVVGAFCVTQSRVAFHIHRRADDCGT